MNHNRILLISPDFPPPFVGGSLVWIHSLLSHSKNKFDVLTANNVAQVKAKNLNIIYSKYLTNSNNPKRSKLLINYLFIFFWCLQNFRKKKYDIVISNPGLIGNCIIFFIGSFFHKKIIGTVYAEELTTAIYGTSLKSKIKVFLIKNFYKYASAFISVCNFSKKILRDYNLNQNIIILPPGGNLKITKKKFTKPSSILSVGRLIKRKGFDKIILATNDLKKSYPDLNLNIIGNGPELQNLKNLILDLNASSFIKINTNINETELSDFYKKSDIFVLANRMLKNGDTEGCPVVFIEAMSYMLPIIGGDGGGVDTAINDGENGFIIDASDVHNISEKLKLLLNNSILIKKMSQNSLKKIKIDHNINEISKKFDNFLNHSN